MDASFRPPPSPGPLGEPNTSCSGREGAACKVSSGKGGIVRREKSTVTRFFLADWQLSSSSPALRMTQAECLLSSFSLYTWRQVTVKGKVHHVMTHTHTEMLAPLTEPHWRQKRRYNDKPDAEEGHFAHFWELELYPQVVHLFAGMCACLNLK